MGFFWNKNKYDICPNADELKCVVTNYSGHNGTLKINGKVIVPSGFEFVIGKRGKVTDKFDEGEHFFNYSSLPYTCRRFGIDKQDNGKRKDIFYCEYYFVDKGLRAGKFKTYRKVEMGTRAYGIFKAHVYGIYSYKVTNSKEFMQSLLNEFDFIKTGEAEEIIESWVNDLVVNALEKNNFILDDVIENKPIIAEKLKQAISKTFAVAGLEICSLEIYKYKLPKQYQEQSDNNIAKSKMANEENHDDMAQKVEMEIHENDDLKENKTIEGKVQETEPITTSSQQVGQEKELEHTDNEYIPFGNFVIKNKVDAENIKDEVVKHSVKSKERTFVDLNLDKLYDKDEPNTKRCTRCGAENNFDASHCILCGENLFDENEEVL